MYKNGLVFFLLVVLSHFVESQHGGQGYSQFFRIPFLGQKRGLLLNNKKQLPRGWSFFENENNTRTEMKKRKRRRRRRLRKKLSWPSDGYSSNLKGPGIKLTSRLLRKNFDLSSSTMFVSFFFFFIAETLILRSPILSSNILRNAFFHLLLDYAGSTSHVTLYIRNNKEN